MADFADNVIKVSAGNIIALLISLLSLPVITRLYTPDSYGVLLIVNSFVSTIVPISGLGYEKALLLPHQNGTVSIVFFISMVAVVVVSIVAGLGVYTSSDFLNSQFGLANNAVYLMFIPAGILLFGLLRILDFWAIRSDHFTEQAISRVSSSVFERSIGILGGYLNANTIWLLFARLINAIVGIGVFLRMLRNGSGLTLRFSAPSVKRCIVVARYYVDFVFSAFATLLNGIARELPPLLLAGLYSPASAGFYGLARATIGMPFFQISDSISRAFFHKMATLHRKQEEIGKPTLKLLRFQMLIGLCPLTVLLLTGDVLVPYLFGPKWTNAGLYTQILGIVFFTSYLYRPVSVFLDLFERQRTRLIIDALFLCASVTSLYLGKILGGELLALKLFAFLMICVYLGAIHYIIRFIGASVRPFFFLAIKQVVLAVIFCLPLILLRIFIGLEPLVIMLGALATLMVYAIYLVMSEQEIRRKLYPVFTRKKHDKSSIL